MPNHYLTQCWVIFNWTLRNKLQWHFDKKNRTFHSRKCFENVCEMAAILSRRRWVNRLKHLLGQISTTCSRYITALLVHDILLHVYSALHYGYAIFIRCHVLCHDQRVLHIRILNYVKSWQMRTAWWMHWKTLQKSAENEIYHLYMQHRIHCCT